jgi:hypothetical protein
MSQTAHRYLIFETAGDFCGIRLERRGHQALPAADQKRGSGRTSSAAPCARPQTRHAHTGGGSAIAAVKRYFEDEETDFSGFKLDLGEPDPFFERIYEAARRVEWATRRPMALWQGNSAPGRKLCAMSARPWPGSGGPDHPLPQGPGGRRQARGVFRAGRLGGRKAHARTGGRSPGSAAAGPAIS